MPAAMAEMPDSQPFTQWRHDDAIHDFGQSRPALGSRRSSR